MGRLNNLKIKIAGTLEAIDLLRLRTCTRDLQQNKGEFDLLFKRLKVLQSRLANWGTTGQITKARLMSGEYIYFTGLSIQETQELLRLQSVSWVSIINITPGKKITPT